MIITPSDAVAVAISSLTWVVASVAIGWVGTRWTLDRLARPGPLTRLRDWEDDGAWWRRHTGVHRWRDRLPEAGALFAGGYSKRHLRSRSSKDLERFSLETVRAERVHWSVMATAPLHALWCRPTVAAGMIGFGVVANLPCIVVQRANRARLQRLLRRRRQQRDGSPLG